LLRYFSQNIACSEKGGVSRLIKYTEEQRNQLFSKADLILEVAFVNVKMVGKGDVANALARAIEEYDNEEDMINELSWVITFEIYKIIKGEFKGAKYNILIHSPSMQFGVNIFKNPKPNARKQYRIYIQGTESCDILIGQELLETKSE